MADTPQIKILKPGTFEDESGQKVTFTDADMVQLAQSYDPASDPAPLVIGHPKTNDPAWGWVGALKVDGGQLVAEPSDIEPAFAEAVKAKRYRRVSASLYPPKHPANPKPGGWYLKHVGFLGAKAPAIKGLGTVSFSDDAEGAVTLTIDQEQQMTDTTDLAEREAALSTREGALAAREQAVQAKESEFAERDRTDAERADQERSAEAVSFAEALVAEGKLAPRAKSKIVTLMGQLGHAATVDFGEADGGQITPLAAFKSLFDDAHPVIALGEHAPADKPGPDAEKDPSKIAQAAVEFAESERVAGRTITIQQAVRHVSAKAD